MSSEIEDVFARLRAKQEELERMRRAIAELKADEVRLQRGTRNGSHHTGSPAEECKLSLYRPRIPTDSHSP
jgi:hypothetical protein